MVSERRSRQRAESGDAEERGGPVLPPTDDSAAERQPSARQAAHHVPIGPSPSPEP